MKRFNGYYGCALCEIRGKHQFWSLSYRHNEETEVRKSDRHYRHSVYFNRGTVEERRKKTEKDSEIKITGVHGYPEIFRSSLISACWHNAPNAERSNKRFTRIFEISGFPGEIENATKAFKLPSEFKRRFQSRYELKHFKANKLKIFCLYFAPVLFWLVLNDASHFRDLC